MKFIIFTSLTTLICLLILFYIFLRIYRRIKPAIKGALSVVESTATAISNGSKEFIQNLNEELSTYNAKHAIEYIRELYDNNNKNLYYLNNIISTDNDKNKIKEKSKKIAAQYYFKTKKEFIQNINENLSTYNAKQAVENIRELYDNNIRNLHYLNSIMFTDEDKNKIKEKSRKIAAQYYFSKKKEFKEYKITAIKSRDINLISEIDKLEAQLDFCYEKITNLKDFVAIEAIEKIKT